MTNETKKSNFSTRLEYLIKYSGVPKKVFAKNCGIKEKQLYVYLRGESEPGLKALKGIKESYPNINIDWLVSGIGEPYLRYKAETPTVIDLRHEQIIKDFEDKEYASELNQVLVSLERLSKKRFYEVGGLIKKVLLDEKGSGKEGRTKDKASGED